jgi:hypothetical protein
MGTTLINRRFKRLTSVEPPAKKPLKRARILNTRSLDTFLKKQRNVLALVRVKKTNKRKVTVFNIIKLPEKAPTTSIPVLSIFNCLVISSLIRFTLA